MTTKAISNHFSQFHPTLLLRHLNSTPLSLSQTQQAHAHILKTAFLNSIRYTTRLLSLYATHQHFDSANHLLHSLPQPEVFSFTPLIISYSKSNLFSHSLGLFLRMLGNGLVPDFHVLPTAIKACAGLTALKLGQQVHGYVLTSGLGSDDLVQSSLGHMYVKCGRLSDAREVLDKIPEPNLMSWTALVTGYAKKGDVSKAKEVFDEMRKLGIEPNLVTWSGMISGFNQSGCYLEAVLMFREMILQGFKPDGVSVSSVLPATGDLEDMEIGVQIHGCVVKHGFGVDKCVVSALIDMYGKCGCSSEMLKVFKEVEEKEVGACNALIAGLSRNGLADEALRMFKQFQGQGMELNVVSWTSMIASCSQHGRDIEALELFREMQMVGVEANSVTIPCLLPACGNIAALMHGKAAHGFSFRRGIFNDVYVGSALIDMYSNCGRIQAARLCFDGMPAHNIVCWNAIMGGYATHGNGTEAMEIFHLMLRSGQKPDFVSFTCILSACSQSGLTEEGQYYFNSMSTEHGVDARMEHYACMVSLLGRAGKLEGAYSMIKHMPFKPDGCVWGALLSSCKVYNNMSLGEVAAYELFELEPRNPGNYILLSNLYASNRKWDEVDKVHDMMKCMGLKKDPGCSWIELKNKVHMLLAGDKSHPQITQIIERMTELSAKMKKSGYVPVTGFVLQDVEEQEKEHILCGHSEKLAVVLGLLNTPPGSSLRVIKNLRICGDCHDVIKFISSCEGREIFVRDTNRFHHFKAGMCSCGDYW